MAVALRNGGLDAPLGALRVLAMGDLTQGRDPLDRLKPAPVEGGQPAAGSPSPKHSNDPAGSPPEPGAPGPGYAGSGYAGPGHTGPGYAGPGYAGPNGRPGWDADGAGNPGSSDPYADDPAGTAPRRPARRTDPAPPPALVNLIVPIGTYLGWSAAPAQAGSWGLLDRDETRVVVAAASRHPRTRWCVTLTNEKGEAIAHACARGQHSWTPEDLPDPRDPGGGRDGPTREQAARLHGLLRSLNLTFDPVARGACDHAHTEDHYTPSRRLRHLVRARTATCDAPGCGAQAVHADLDHTVPYPDGPTDECNLGPRCRTHHRCKQAPDWKVEQAAPGVTRWTLPSGRTRTTTPTTYDA
jgi:hypothetical protein